MLYIKLFYLFLFKNLLYHLQSSMPCILFSSIPVRICHVIPEWCTTDVHLLVVFLYLHNDFFLTTYFRFYHLRNVIWERENNKGVYKIYFSLLFLISFFYSLHSVNSDDDDDPHHYHHDTLHTLKWSLWWEIIEKTLLVI